jgi:hypothetical protein
VSSIACVEHLLNTCRSDAAEAAPAPAAPEPAAEEAKEEKVVSLLSTVAKFCNQHFLFIRKRSRKRTNSSPPELLVVSLLAWVTSSSKNLSKKSPLLRRLTSIHPRSMSLHLSHLWRILHPSLPLLLLPILLQLQLRSLPNLSNPSLRLLLSLQRLHNLVWLDEGMSLNDTYDLFYISFVLLYLI